MAYRKLKYLLGDVIETEIKYSGKYGAKGEKRAPKKKATPEQIKKQNLWKKINHLRRLIILNFIPYDFFCTLKYPRGTRKPIEEVERDVRDFIDRLRAPYKRAQVPLKYIYRIEIGKRGGIHVHIIIKRLPKNGDRLIQEKWKAGRVNFTNLYDSGGYQDLAEYMGKEPPEEMEGQLSLFSESDKKRLRSYVPSRNLEKPVPEVKEYKRRTVQKILVEGPEPSEGFYIDKGSIRQGLNPYTGYSYLYYTEYRLGKVPWGEGVP
ncbi:MAG: hypothetical protein IKK59_05695 [Lachnospiraceae bacterium]|nr:hypothetical protein [Lachnospiraceae bacterium]